MKRFFFLALLIAAISFSVLEKAQALQTSQMENGPCLQWPFREFYGIAQTLYTPHGFSFLHTGVDIPMRAGTPVYSPLSGKIAYHLTEDLNVLIESEDKGIAIQINHLDKEHLPSFLEGKEQDVFLPEEIAEGNFIGQVVDGDFGDYENHIHLEIRKLGTNLLLNPLGFFVETTAHDHFPPRIGEVYIRSLSSEPSNEPKLISSEVQVEVTDHFELIMEISDVVTDRLKTYSMDRNGQISETNVILLPKKVILKFNGREIKTIDFSEMPSIDIYEVGNPTFRRVQETGFNKNKNEIFFVGDLEKPYTLKEGVFIDARSKDDFDMDLFKLPEIQRKYMVRSGIIAGSQCEPGKNTLEIIVQDFGGNQRQKLLNFFCKSSSNATLPLPSS